MPCHATSGVVNHNPIAHKRETPRNANKAAGLPLFCSTSGLTGIAPLIIFHSKPPSSSEAVPMAAANAAICRMPNASSEPNAGERKPVSKRDG